jgi:hypothetical protein
MPSIDFEFFQIFFQGAVCIHYCHTGVFITGESRLKKKNLLVQNTPESQEDSPVSNTLGSLDCLGYLSTITSFGNMF